MSVIRGSEAELVVAAELTKRGFGVSMPLSHSSKYDLILDVAGRLYKLQVKRAYWTMNRAQKVLCVETRQLVTQRSGKGGTVVKHYQPKDYDFLVACDLDNNDFWFIPDEVAQNYKAQIYLSTGRLDQYKNQWPESGVEKS